VKGLFPFRQPLAKNPKARLFCLPFAGGAAVIFKAWSEALAEDGIDVCAIELPARGTRFSEPPIDDPKVICATLAEALRPYCHDGVPIVWFGHSLGARLGFAVARALNKADAFIASGARAPSRAVRVQRTHLSKDDFIASLTELGGTPPEILEDKELLELFLPMLRADFNLVDKLIASRADKLACPITKLTATDDPEVDLIEASAWQSHTTGQFELVAKDGGGHFFLMNDTPWVLANVRRVCKSVAV